MKKRLLSTVLALALVFSSFSSISLHAFADNEETGEETGVVGLGGTPQYNIKSISISAEKGDVTFTINTLPIWDERYKSDIIMLVMTEQDWLDYGYGEDTDETDSDGNPIYEPVTDPDTMPTPTSEGLTINKTWHHSDDEDVKLTLTQALDVSTTYYVYFYSGDDGSGNAAYRVFTLDADGNIEQDPAKAEVTGTEVTYNGSKQEPTFTVKTGKAGDGTDITDECAITYKNSKGAEVTEPIDADTYSYEIKHNDYAIANGTGTFTISKAEIKVTDWGSIIPEEKSYDGGTSVDTSKSEITAPEFSGIASSDNEDGKLVNVTYAWESANAAVENKIIISASLNTSHADAKNYTMTDASTTVDTDVTIQKAPKTITLKDSYEVTYNGSAATVENTVTPVDTDGLTQGTDFVLKYYKGDDELTETPKDAGDYTVLADLTWAALQNYSLTSVTESNKDTSSRAALTINKRPVSLTALELTKTYDGNATDVYKKGADSKLSPDDLSLVADDPNDGLETGVISADSGNVSLVEDGEFSAVYDYKDVDDASKVTISGIKLSGDSAENYTLGTDPLTMSASITKAGLTVSFPDTITKTKDYDGDTNVYKTVEDTVSQLTVSDLVVTGAVNSESPTLDATAGAIAYDNATAGTGKTITASGYALADDSEDADVNKNYTLTNDKVTANDGEINKVNSTLTAAPVGKTGLTYNCAAQELVTGGTATGGTVQYSTDGENYSADLPTGTDAGDYSIWYKVVGDENHNDVAAAKLESAVNIAKGSYTAPDTIEGTIAIGTAIAGFEIAGEVTAADGTTKVSGKFKITNTDKGNAEANQTYENLNWTFYPDTANANYNELTGSNAKLTAADKSDNANKPAVTPVNATAVGGNGKLVISIAEGDTATSKTAAVEYKSTDAADWTKTALADGTVTVEVPAGTYEVRYAETDTTKASASVQAVVSDVADNNNTPDVISTAPTTLDGKGTITISKKADDTVTSATAPVQYRVKGTEDWTDTVLADGTVTVDAAPGTYEVRYAATDGFAPGEIVEVVVSEAATYKITVTEPTNGTFTYTVDGGVPTSTDTAKVLEGAAVAIETTPASGYKVSKITLTDPNGKTTTVSTSKREFTMPANDVTLTVTFSKKGGGGGSSSTTYKVTFDAADNGKITSGSKTLNISSGAKIASSSVPTVTANEDYTFLGWSQDGETIVDPTTVAISKATTFTALYEKEGDSSSTATPTPAPTDEPQTVTETEAHDAYIYGYEDDTFAPDNAITRAEAAAIITRALTDFDEDAEYPNTLADVDGSEWFASSVNYLANLGVITGYEDGTFRPYDSITRQEFAAMIALINGTVEAGDTPFTDVSDANWGADYIYTVYANGWVSGYEDGTFRPENNVTRAEVVTIVNGCLERGTDAAGLANASYTEFPDVTEAHWAYYDIIEAANDHTFEKDTAPEIWVD